MSQLEEMIDGIPRSRVRSVPSQVLPCTPG